MERKNASFLGKNTQGCFVPFGLTRHNPFGLREPDNRSQLAPDFDEHLENWFIYFSNGNYLSEANGSKQYGISEQRSNIDYFKQNQSKKYQENKLWYRDIELQK